MARCQAQQHGRAFLGFTPDRGARADHAQRSAAGDAQGWQGFGSEELADRRTQYRTAIPHARVWRLPGALEVQVPGFAGVVVHFAQQQAAAITQARIVGAELMPGVDHRPRLGLGPQLVAAEQFGKYRGMGFGWLQVEQRHGRFAGDHQARLGDRLGQHRSREGIAQAGETVIESQFVEGFQRPSPGENLSILQGYGRWRPVRPVCPGPRRRACRHSWRLAARSCRGFPPGPSCTPDPACSSGRSPSAGRRC
ncbi:hypothetical protein D3C80_1242110 [compost metagenome]